MGLRLRTISCGFVAVACALGCNALTGADALAIDKEENELSSSSGNTVSSDGEPSGGGASSSGSSSGAASSSSSSSSSSSGGGTDGGSDAPTPSPSIINETFALEAACTNLAVTNGASTSYEPSGHDSAGACRLCATSAGALYAELSGTSTSQGQATFEAYVRRAPGAASPTSATIQLQIGGSNISSSKNVDETWVRLGGGSISVQSGASVQLRVGLPSATAGECLVIDDARVVVP